MGKGKSLFYFEDKNEAARILDEYDFENFLDYYYYKGIQDAYEIETALSKELGGDVEEAIESLSIEEFVDYLSDRYTVTFVEIISYEMRKSAGNVGKRNGQD